MNKNDTAKTSGTIPNHPVGFIQTAPNETFNWYGLTKREYFAAMCIQGLLSGEELGWEENEYAKFSVRYADALIDELNK